MDVHVKVKYGCDKQNIEGFGDNRYLIYLLSVKDEEDSWAELIALLSRKLGVPENNIVLKRNMGDNKVFFVN